MTSPEPGGGLKLNNEERNSIIDDAVAEFENEPDEEILEALEHARLLVKVFEALLEERESHQQEEDDVERARAFILSEMEKARKALREIDKEPEILTPADINPIRIPKHVNVGSEER